MKAFIFFFDALASLAITGILLDKGEDSVSSTDQGLTIGILGAIYFIAALIIAVVKFATDCCGIDKCTCSEEVKKNKKILSFLFLVLDSATVCVVALYYVGDNFENFLTDDRREIKKSTYILIAALLGFQVLRLLEHLLQKLKKIWDMEDEEDDIEKMSDISFWDFFQAYISVVIAIFALIPEYDGAYTTYLKLVNLTTGTCHQTANYNALWVVWAALVVLLGLHIAYMCIPLFIAVYKMCSNGLEYLEAFVCVLSILALFLIIVPMGLFLIADNNLPLDCSRHISEEDTPKYRVAFLVIAISIYLVIALATAIFQCCYNFCNDSWCPKCRNCSSQPTNTSVQ